MPELKPDLKLCPNHTRSVSNAPNRYYPSAIFGPAVSDGNGWYVPGKLSTDASIRKLWNDYLRLWEGK